jgi:putative addiction module killer protein
MSVSFRIQYGHGRNPPDRSIRIDYGPGYRIYFIQRGAALVILLAGGNKSTQDQDIRIALQLARGV